MCSFGYIHKHRFRGVGLLRLLPSLARFLSLGGYTIYSRPLSAEFHSSPKRANDVRTHRQTDTLRKRAVLNDQNYLEEERFVTSLCTVVAWLCAEQRLRRAVEARVYMRQNGVLFSRRR